MRGIIFVACIAILLFGAQCQTSADLSARLKKSSPITGEGLDDYLIGLRSFARPLRTKIADLDTLKKLETQELKFYMLTGRTPPVQVAQPQAPAAPTPVATPPKQKRLPKRKQRRVKQRLPKVKARLPRSRPQSRRGRKLHSRQQGSRKRQAFVPQSSPSNTPAVVVKQPFSPQPAKRREERREERKAERREERKAERAPERAPDRRNERAPERRVERRAERAPERREERRAEKRAERREERRAERKAERAAERREEKKPERRVERREERRAERKEERRAEKRAERREERKAERRAERASERREDRKSEKRAERREERKAEKRAERKAERAAERREERRSERKVGRTPHSGPSKSQERRTERRSERRSNGEHRRPATGPSSSGKHSHARPEKRSHKREKPNASHSSRQPKRSKPSQRQSERSNRNGEKNVNKRRSHHGRESNDVKSGRHNKSSKKHRETAEERHDRRQHTNEEVDNWNQRNKKYIQKHKKELQERKANQASKGSNRQRRAKRSPETSEQRLDRRAKTRKSLEDWSKKRQAARIKRQINRANKQKTPATETSEQRLDRRAKTKKLLNAWTQQVYKATHPQQVGAGSSPHKSIRVTRNKVNPRPILRRVVSKVKRLAEVQKKKAVSVIKQVSSIPEVVSRNPTDVAIRRLKSLQKNLVRANLPKIQVPLNSWTLKPKANELKKIKNRIYGKQIKIQGKVFRSIVKATPITSLTRALRDYLNKRVEASHQRNPYAISTDLNKGKVKHFIPISTYKDRIESFKPYAGISLAQYGSKYQHIKYTADIDNPGLDLVKVTALNVMKMKDGRYQHTAGYAWTFGSSVVTYRLERKRQCSRMSSSSSASPSSSSNSLKTSNGNAYGRQLIRNLMIGNAPSSTSSSVPTKLSLNSRNSATNPLGTNYATKTVSTTFTQAPTSSKIVTKTTTTTPSGAKVVSKVSTKVTPVTSTAAAAPKSPIQGNKSALKSTGNGSSSNKPSANNASNSQGNGSQGQDKLTGRERAAQVQQRNLDRQEARSNVPLGLQSMKVIIKKSLEARMAYLNQFIRTKLQTKTYNYQDMIDEDDSSIRDYKPFIDDSVVPGPGETCEYKDILVPNGFTPKEEGYVKKRLSTLAFRNIAVMLSSSQRKLNNIYENTEAIEFKEYTDYETLEGVSEINIKTAIIKMLDGLTTESWTEADLKTKGSLTLKNEGREVAYIELKSTNVANVYDLTVLTGK